jgi:hypothetical protein
MGLATPPVVVNVPFPSSPYMLSPQHQTVPSASNAQVCSLPAATALAARWQLPPSQKYPETQSAWVEQFVSHAPAEQISLPAQVWGVEAAWQVPALQVLWVTALVPEQALPQAFAL